MLNIHEKMHLRSIKLLVNSMVREESEEERQRIADEISKLIEDYIAECSEEQMEDEDKKQEVTIELDNSIVDYFNKMQEDTGIPFDILINLYLADCVKENKRLKFV